MKLQNHSRGNQDPKAKKSARFGIPVANSTQPAEFRGFKIGQRLSLAGGLRGTGFSLWIFDFAGPYRPNLLGCGSNWACSFQNSKPTGRRLCHCNPN
jgi:hypothetical protein